MKRILYLPSTPLNILVSVALANQFRDQHQANIFLIDQKNITDNPYMQALENWAGSPFTDVKALPGHAKKLKEKLSERKENFHRLQESLIEFQPEIVAVGSDRRIEFQYVMQQLKLQNKDAQGWYLDDGLYSYAGRPYHVIKDGINRYLKKIIYGLWWDEPKTIGASSWIHQAWLFEPNFAFELLNTKKIKRLESSWFKDSKVREFSQLVIEQFNFNAEVLNDIDVVLIIPHPNDQLKMKNYTLHVQRFIEQLTTQAKRVALKYHPRQQGHDALGLAESSLVTIIPAGLAFEFVLPMLPSAVKVIGDVCTVLLTTKWLRNDLQPIALLNQHDPYQLKFLDMFIENKIQVIKADGTLNISNFLGECIE